MKNAALILLAATLIPSTALGQGQRRDDPYKPGHLQPPKPYGDRGSSTLGGPATGPRRPAPGPGDPARYWKDRIFTAPGYGGDVIILNGGIYGSPWYYGYGQPAYGQYYFGFSYGAAGGPGGSYRSGQQRLQRQDQYDRPQKQTTPPGRSEEPAARPDSEPEPYYLHRKPKADSPLGKDASLAQAVADIESAFRTGSIAPLEKHLNPADVLMLQTKGQTRKPMAGADYLDMTREAFKSMKTVRFSLDKVEPASNGAWLVHGSHVLRTEEGAEQTFTVGFVLKKRGEQWVIAEVSADAAR